MDRTFIEKFGTVGAIIAAAACPICFPKIALIGAALGLGAFAPFEDYIAVGVQALFILALIGQVLAYPRHRNVWLLALSGATTILLFSAYYVFSSSAMLQLSLLGLAVASVWLIVEVKRCAKCAADSKEEKADA